MIQSYNELRAAIANWLNRDDLTDRIPEFISLAEADMRRRLLTRVTTTTISIASEATPLTNAVLEPLELWLRNGAERDYVLYPRTPVQLSEFRTLYPTPGPPRYYAVMGRQIRVVPVPDKAYTAELVYRENFVPATSSEPGLILEAPDLYLYGSLIHAATYLEHDERVPVWLERYERALATLNEKRAREESELSLMPMRLPVVF